MTRATVFFGLALLVVSGCASHQGRFADRPVVWRVADDESIAEPEEREFLLLQFAADVMLTRRLTRALELRDTEPAHNTNALDEVPDSTWFENRIGVREVSPKEAARGSSDVGPPELPITVIGGKTGGGNPGFLAEDARGLRFLLKFDTKENPGLQTSASVIVNRIFYALGYNVPNDDVFHFSRRDLRLGPEARIEDEYGDKKKMTLDDVEEALESAPRMSDGRYRASSSELLSGIPKGGFPAEGVRGDDPNDVVAHEHRRELRGLRVFAAWVNHTDMKEDNTLDMYVEEGGRRFLRHYLLDFGEALGGHPAEKQRYEDGFEHYWDWERQSRAFVSLGLWKRPWEDVRESPWPSVGPFGPEPFDPRYWREAYPYFPFFEMDAADAFWAAKLVLRFDRPILEAIVAEAKMSDPSAARYLVDTLLARQRKIGAAYLEALTPLDHFEAEPGRICAVDLGVHHGLAKQSVVQALDDMDEVVGQYVVGREGRVCVSVHQDDEYRFYRLRVVRGRDEKPPMQVHFKGGPRPRVLGIIRVER